MRDLRRGHERADHGNVAQERRHRVLTRPDHRQRMGWLGQIHEQRRRKVRLVAGAYRMRAAVEKAVHQHCSPCPVARIAGELVAHRRD
jgi:hypothetical protein